MKVALLIGVNEYGAGLRPLPAGPKDVAAIQAVLQNTELGGFDLVKPLINPKHWEMEREIELWFRDRQKDDLVLLFFSGHGIKDERGDLYLAASNTQKDERGELIKSTAVAASFVHNCSRDSKSKRQVLILDCCFSGAFGNLVTRDDSSINLERQLGAEGRVVLTSTSAIQYSFEEKDVDLSIYTRYIVEGIQTGAADQDNDGFISVQELHEYACRKVQETAPSMSPKIIVLRDEGFDIKIATAKVTDTKLKYYREVERYAKRGEIPAFGRMILNTLRSQLNLSAKETAEIEETVLRPYRDRLENIQRYQDAFAAAVKAEFPLSEDTRRDLKHYQEMLGLRREDITPVEAEVIPPTIPKFAQKAETGQKAKVASIPTPPATEPNLDVPVPPPTPATAQTPPIQNGAHRTSNPRRQRTMFLSVGVAVLVVAGIGYSGYRFWEQAQANEQARIERLRQLQVDAIAAKKKELEKTTQLEQAQKQLEEQRQKALLEDQKQKLSLTTPSILGLVCISNQTTQPISFQYRWASTEAVSWSNFGGLLPGNWGVLHWPYRMPNENKSPPLQIRVDTDMTAQVNAKVYIISSENVTAMPVADCNQIGTKGYVFRLANPTSLELVKPGSISTFRGFSSVQDLSIEPI